MTNIASKGAQDMLAESLTVVRYSFLLPVFDMDYAQARTGMDS